MGFPLNASSHLKPPYPAPSELRIRGLRAAECIQRENHRVPLSSVFGGLLAGGIMARFARLEGASCCGMHSEGNPSGPFVLGLQGLGLKGLKCASRPMRSAARASCVLRSVPKSKLMAGPAMSGLRRISRWVRVVLGATCKKRSFQQPKIDA